ncbi:hypothetical protein MKW94_025889 [Papaver nudicaule]|uniref:Cytochrome P450 n=1 Tax=Papaver nudicaule TaxID=74823 RepID=A0AA41SCW4_PAPNU|nr:hypothetical protein [Papaver nudicaule]
MRRFDKDLEICREKKKRLFRREREERFHGFGCLLYSFLMFLTKTSLVTNLSQIYIVVSIVVVLFIKFGFDTLRKQSFMSASAPLPPGPTPWPIVGSLPTSNEGDETEIACIRLGNVNVIPVTSPELAREFLKKHDAMFSSRARMMGTEYMTRGYLTTVFVPYGEQWKKMRRIISSELVSPARLDWLFEKRNEEDNNLVFYIYNQCVNSVDGGGEVVDVRLAIRHYTGNVVRKMIFNTRYFGKGRKDGGPGIEEVEHIDSVSKGLSFVYAFCISDFLPYMRWLGFEGHEKIMKETRKVIHKYHDPLIDERIQQWSNKKDGQMPKKVPGDLLDVLISLEADGKPVLSTEEIKAESVELFYVTIDNTSNAIEWAMAEMITQPDILRKAVQEIDMLVGKDRLVQESDCPKLNYVKACAWEALRLHPLESFNVLHVLNSDQVVGGNFIPKGSHVVLSRYGLGRNARIWDEPFKFMPERHLKFEDGSLAKVDLAVPELRFMSFGIPLSTTIATMSWARLLQGFEWSPPYGDQSRIDLSESNVNHSMANPLLAHAKPRLPAHVYTTAKI